MGVGILKFEYPRTRKEDLVEDFHGVGVKDPYRWLEDKSNPNVRLWIESQNALTSSYLEDFEGLSFLETRLKELYTYGMVDPDRVEVRGTSQRPRFFYLLRLPGQSQSILYYQDGHEGERIELVSPVEITSESFVSIDWFYPSNDGSLVAYGLSEGGTENSVLHIIEVEAKRILDERIPKTQFCAVAWLPDNSGFYYSRYPLPGTVSPKEEFYYVQVFYHEIGSDYRNDARIFGEGRDPTEFNLPIISADGFTLAILSYRYTESDVYLSRVNSKEPTNLNFATVIEGRPTISLPHLHDSTLYLYTQENAPNGQVLSYELGEFFEGKREAKVIIEEGEGVISLKKDYAFAPFSDKISVIEEKDALCQLKVYNRHTGMLLQSTEFDTPTTITRQIIWEGIDAVYFTMNSFYSPTMISFYDDSQGFGTLYEPQLNVNQEEFSAKQVWFSSKDGTRVPMFLLSKDNTKIGVDTPVLLTGYGGFAISMTPTYRPAYMTWAENGGVVAIANLRGGGEYGLEWHTSGNRENKQNVFDDFISAAEYLIDNKIGSRETLAIAGGSNGGLLVGAALVQRPDLFKCVYCAVPLLDMIRFGNFHYAKTWMTEYGNPEEEKDFQYLYSYSPYHNAAEGVEYPATLLYTAEGDGRVDTMHALKMTALLQKATASLLEESPILLWVESKAGHGVGLPVDTMVKSNARYIRFLANYTGLSFPS
jgi:prolyl oligopeptidase